MTARKASAELWECTMRTGLLSAAAVLAVVLAVPSGTFAKQNSSTPSAGMMHRVHLHAPVNPPRFQPVKAGPLKGPAVLPPGFRDRSIPIAALPQSLQRHTLRGHHAHHHQHRHAPGFGLGYLGNYSYAPYAYAYYVYEDPESTYAQDPRTTYQRLTPAGQCWTQSVPVSPDRSRDVRITRC